MLVSTFKCAPLLELCREIKARMGGKTQGNISTLFIPNYNIKKLNKDFLMGRVRR